MREERAAEERAAEKRAGEARATQAALELERARAALQDVRAQRERAEEERGEERSQLQHQLAKAQAQASNWHLASLLSRMSPPLDTPDLSPTNIPISPYMFTNPPLLCPHLFCLPSDTHTYLFPYPPTVSPPIHPCLPALISPCAYACLSRKHPFPSWSLLYISPLSFLVSPYIPPPPCPFLSSRNTPFSVPTLISPPA